MRFICNVHVNSIFIRVARNIKKLSRMFLSYRRRHFFCNTIGIIRVSGEMSSPVIQLLEVSSAVIQFSFNLILFPERDRDQSCERLPVS